MLSNTHVSMGSPELRLEALRRKLLLSATHPSMGSDEHLLVEQGHQEHRRGLKYKIWQTGFYDFNVFSPKKLHQKLNYIHYNPVKAGLCAEVEEYPFSSAWYYEGLKKPNGLNEIICPVDEL